MKRLAGLLLVLGLLPVPGAPAQDRPGGPKDPAPARPAERKRLAEKDDAKDLAIDLVEGGTWSPAAAKGKVTVIVFAGDWSAESLEALKRLGQPKGKVAAAGAEVLGVLRDCGAEKARKTAKAQALDLRLAVDPKRKAYDLCAKSGLPYTVVIDRAGKVALTGSGFDEEAVAKKVAALLRD